MKLRGLVLISLLSLLVAASGCATAEPEDSDVPKLYHYNWWNFYQRGTELLAVGKVEAAKKDFERALGLISGARFGFPQDLWRARTYGLHFLEEYFPHRELGICHYMEGETEKALHYLAKSMEQEPSGRAKFYLNLSRERQLQGQNMKPPAIELDQAARKKYLRDRQFEVKGMARSDGYVKSVAVNRSPSFIELAQTELPFSETVDLVEGSNLITISVTDLAGRQTRKTYAWVADWTPPQLLIRRVSKEGSEWVLEGVCADEGGLSAVSISNAKGERPLLERGRVSKRVPVTLRFGLDDKVLFMAEDRAGNALDTVLEGSALTKQEAQDWQHRRYAAAETDEALDAGREVQPAAKKVDRTAPELQLGVDAITRGFHDELFLDGRVDDANGVASISLNGEELLHDDDRGVVSLSFARRVPLDVGTNVFRVVVKDMAGNETSKQLQSIRKVPSHLDKQYRLSVVLAPLVTKGEVREIAPHEIKFKLEGELTQEPARFFLLERAEGWDLLLQEQALSVSDLTDPRAAISLGKILPVEMMMTGVLIPQGKGATIFASLVDMETGEILASDDIYSERLRDELGYQVGGLVMKLKQQFPLLQGRIVRQSGRKADVDIGSSGGLRDGMKFLIVEAENEDSAIEDGKVRKINGDLVELNIMKVTANSGVARVEPGKARGQAKVGDYIYAR